MCGNDGLQQVSGLFFPGMDTIPLRSLHAKGGVGRTQKTTYDFNSNERVQSSECTAIVFIFALQLARRKNCPTKMRRPQNCLGPSCDLCTAQAATSSGRPWARLWLAACHQELEPRAWINASAWLLRRMKCFGE